MPRWGAVLIDGFDAVAAGCITEATSCTHTVLYRHPEWAQRHAQMLWDRAGQANRLEAVRATRFVPRAQWKEIYGRRYDLIYCWIPFARYQDSAAGLEMLAAVGTALVPGGVAFVAGPAALRAHCASQALQVLAAYTPEELGRLPLLTEHLRLHPRTRLRSDLALFLAEKGIQRGARAAARLTAPG